MAIFAYNIVHFAYYLSGPMRNDSDTILTASNSKQ